MGGNENEDKKITSTKYEENNCEVVFKIKFASRKLFWFQHMSSDSTNLPKNTRQKSLSDSPKSP